MERIAFKYDPLVLTKITLQIHLEKTYSVSQEEADEMGHPNSLRYAIFDYMASADLNEIERLIETYAEADNVTEITLEKPQLERLAHHLLQTERFKQLRWEYQLKGSDGMGVLDLSRKTFTPCGFVQHGDTLKALLKEHHGNYGEAYEYIMFGGRTEYAGIKAGNLIAYIRKNFKFIDTQRQVDQLEPSR